MNRKEFLSALIFKTNQRSIIIESGSLYKSLHQLKEVLKENICAFSFGGFCDECRDCKRINKLETNAHPDILYYGGELFSVAEARDLINKSMSEPIEFQSRFVIFNVEKLSPESQNTILKLLEEDNEFEAKSKFIFIVRKQSSLLETIQSRSVLVTLESNSKREFEKLVSMRGFQKSDFVAYVCSGKETLLNKAVYIRDKFNLNLDELQEKVLKIYNQKQLNQDIFDKIDELKMFPYIFVYRAIEHEFIRNSKNIMKLKNFYSLFFKENYNKTKNVKENLAGMLNIWYYLNKENLYNKYSKV